MGVLSRVGGMSVIVVTLTVQGYEQAKYSKYSGMIISLGPGSAVEKAKKKWQAKRAEH